MTMGRTIVCVVVTNVAVVLAWQWWSQREPGEGLATASQRAAETSLRQTASAEPALPRLTGVQLAGLLGLATEAEPEAMSDEAADVVAVTEPAPAATAEPVELGFEPESAPESEPGPEPESADASGRGMANYKAVREDLLGVAEALVRLNAQLAKRGVGEGVRDGVGEGESALP